MALFHTRCYSACRTTVASDQNPGIISHGRPSGNAFLSAGQSHESQWQISGVLGASALAKGGALPLQFQKRRQEGGEGHVLMYPGWRGLEALLRGQDQGVRGGGGHGLEEVHPCNRMETFESGP